jgi:uncharacterized protein (DUF4415 family)
MKIEFDPARSSRNKVERGLPFELASDFDFETALYLQDRRKDYGELRIRAFGFIGHRLHALVFKPVDGEFGSSACAGRIHERKSTMSKRKHPEAVDLENPEWTAGDFRRTITFKELPKTLKATLRGPGRPRKSAPKVPVSLRLSPEVVEGFKATGKGWQSRLDTALREWLDKNRAA